MNFILCIILQSILFWNNGVCQWGIHQCGQILRNKRIVIEQPAQLPEVCSYTIQTFSDQACQLLIQFERFTLQQPILQDMMIACGDRFTIDDFLLCGDNSGQHLYFPFPTTATSNRKRHLTLNFHLPNRWSGTQWRLVVRQLECPHSMEGWRLSRLPGFGFQQSIEDMTRTIFPPPTFGDLELLAPAGCQQYYTQPTGTIKSFNFNATRGTLYMPKMKYAICIKSKMGARKIDYNFRKFSMSIANANFAGYDDECHVMVATAGRPADFLMIPQAALTNQPIIQPTYYCGRSLQGQQVSASSPFIIYFESDDFADPIETGFNIDYVVKNV